MGETRHGSRRLYIDYPAERQRERERERERHTERERERERETLFRGTLQLPKLITAGASVPGIINPAGKDDPSASYPRGCSRQLFVVTTGRIREAEPALICRRIRFVHGGTPRRPGVGQFSFHLADMLPRDAPFLHFSGKSVRLISRAFFAASVRDRRWETRKFDLVIARSNLTGEGIARKWRFKP